MNQDKVDTLEICGKTIEVYLDDYGQCYILKYEENGETQYKSCGTYNTEYEDYARMLFDTEYKLNHFRSIGVILATDRYGICKQTAKVLHKLFKFKLARKLFKSLPYVGRDEEDIFNMLYGSWNVGPRQVRQIEEVKVGKCPVCGAGANEDMSYCMKCGNKLEWTENEK